MNVKVRGAVYQSDNEPVMVTFSEDEKQKIGDMEGNSFCVYPDGLDPKAVEAWMVTKGPLGAKS